VLAAHFAARWPFRGMPFVRDEGELVHLGRQILRGAVPYLDVYVQKTPFAFYLLAGVQALCGASVEAIRVATTLWGTLTAVAVFLCARTLFGARAAPWAAAAFCVMSFDQGGIVHAASTEYFMLLWLALGAWLWYAGAARGEAALPLLAGACAGLAYQTKQSGAFLLLFFAAEAAWRSLVSPGGAALRRGARALALAAAGFAVVLGATLAAFAAQGALDAYVEATWTRNLAYVAERHDDALGTLALLRLVLVRVVRWDVGLWALGAAALAAVAVRAPRAPAASAWILLAGALGAGIGAGGPYAHYWEPLIVPLALGVGAGCAALAAAVAARGPLPARAALGVALAAPWLWPAHHAALSLADPAAALAAASERLPPMGESPAVAAWLAERTQPGEPILVIGSEPQIYWYADRPAASRMIHTYLLTGPYAFARELRARYLHELREHGPRRVLMVDLGTSLSEYPRHAAAFAAEAHAVLAERYVLERAFPDAERGALKLFRRKDAAP
jgi:hypothetical protein